jgi:hypothetical protein
VAGRAVRGGEIVEGVHTLAERHVDRLANIGFYIPHTVQAFARRGDVEGDHRLALLRKPTHEPRADKATGAGYQSRHATPTRMER